MCAPSVRLVVLAGMARFIARFGGGRKLIQGGNLSNMNLGELEWIVAVVLASVAGGAQVISP